jgi:anti-sigma factor (TIGR02949 family)
MSAPARTQLEALGLSASCAEVLRHLWDYLDEEVTPTSAERLRGHIAACPQCKEYSAYQSCFLEAVSHLRQELSAPGSLRARLAQRLKGQGCGCWEQVRSRGDSESSLRPER